MATNKELISLQFPFFEDDYEAKLQKLSHYIEKAPKDSVIVAPELCLTNFSFDYLKKAAEFGVEALK